MDHSQCELYSQINLVSNLSFATYQQGDPEKAPLSLNLLYDSQGDVRILMR